jgi:hypothetical protein
MTVGKRSVLTQPTIGVLHLYENIIFYINCRRTNGTTMLKSTSHDSMSGEHVGTTSGLIITSGNLVIWPLETPKNQGFRKLRKFPMEGKKTWEKLINRICEEAGRFQVCWEMRLLIYLLL